MPGKKHLLKNVLDKGGCLSVGLGYSLQLVLLLDGVAVGAALQLEKYK